MPATADDNIIGVPLTFKKTIELSQDNLNNLDYTETTFASDTDYTSWIIKKTKVGVGTNPSKTFYIEGRCINNNEYIIYVPENAIGHFYQLDDYGITTPGWYMYNWANTELNPYDPPAIIIENIYFDAEWLYTLFCVEKTVDGWNKVTVDGPVVDIESLPTENVDKSKIYRIQGPTNIIGIYTINPFNGGIFLADILNSWAESGDTTSIDYYVVDELPTDPKLSVFEDTVYVFHVYFLGEELTPYITTDGSNWESLMYAYAPGIQGDYYGIITDISQINSANDNGFYVVADSSTIYGIPSNATVQRFVDGVWVELT